MSKIRLKSITETSWIVIEGQEEEKAGILNKHPNDMYSLIYKSQQKKFKDKMDLLRFFDQDIFKNVVNKKLDLEKNKTNYVKGFPTDLEELVPVDGEHDLPVYTKTEKSDIMYSAGYYCVHYPKGWLRCFCPKLSTLEKYGYQGPFKTEEEMKTVLTNLKKNEKSRKL